MNVLDLFSGIGGFSLGLERAGMRTVAFCEIEPFQRAVLRKHWPDVPCYDDIRQLTAGRLRTDGISVDVICGGFPCQDVSASGARVGIGGARSGLWNEYARLIVELRPNYVIVENVSGLLDRGLDVVLGTLAALGYDAEWHCIPATALGFPHERDRIWIVAYPAALRRDEGCGSAEGWGRIVWSWLCRGSPLRAQAANDDKIRSRFVRVIDGLPDHAYRLGALGNAVVPQIPEAIGRAIMTTMTSQHCREGDQDV